MPPHQTHRLDEDVHSDLPVFGRGINPLVEMAREDAPYLATSALSDWVIGRIEHGDRRELTVYAVLRAQLNERETCPWQKIADIEDEVTDFAFTGDTIYLLTHKDAPRYKVLATSLREPDLARASVIVPESEAVVEALLTAGGSLLTLDLAGGSARMRHVHLSSGEIAPVALPFNGTIREWMHDEANGAVFFKMESWFVAPRAYRYDTGNGLIEDSELIPPSPLDMSAMEVHEVFAPAHDGTQIPLSIMYKKGLTLDGNNPTILEGYGSYGISLRALFQGSMLAWFERGGVYAVAHIRGGGEYGDAWHKAGQMLNKHTTIEDFIACGEHLVKQGYTRPERLVGQGGSAGGIPTGGALVRRPDLWAAMLMYVPVTNTLRSEFTENGPPNIQEFGSVTTEDGFRDLAITDSYTRVQDGVAYPAVLLTGGFNDPRVVVWQPAKMAARLQAATSSRRPVLLRVEYQGGHGIGSTRTQDDELLADVLAFALEQCSLA
ncbi:MAG: prolyl oligopeptidase family serine peptidase [Ktedonobacteraceae bacterium]